VTEPVEPVAPAAAGELTERTLGQLSPDALEHVYETLLQPVFRSEELMTLDELRSAYTTGSSDPSCVLQEGDIPVAVMLGEWYASHRLLLLAYMAVSSHMRSQGLGARLMTTVLPRWYSKQPNAIVIAEVDDPRCWASSEEGGDPEARLRFYERYGGRLLPLRYFQPSLRPGSDRVHGMFLLSLHSSGKLSADVLREFLSEYFTVCEGTDAMRDPEVIDLISSAAAVGLDGATWPVSRWNDIPVSEKLASTKIVNDPNGSPT
jgi:hypothetical protein